LGVVNKYREVLGAIAVMSLSYGHAKHSRCMQIEGSTRHTLVANLVWDGGCTSGHGPLTLLQASQVLLELISTTSTPVANDGTLRPLVDIESSEKQPNLDDWRQGVGQLLQALQRASPGEGESGGGGGESAASEHGRLSEDTIQV
jgi:hypothetical protein